MSRAAYPYVIVDAFASGPFTGNPAAVLVLLAPLPHDTMLKIAA
jgi:predicted PhzF superfamily epimerase YddE/YHI9